MQFRGFHDAPSSNGENCKWQIISEVLRVPIYIKTTETRYKNHICDAKFVKMFHTHTQKIWSTLKIAAGIISGNFTFSCYFILFLGFLHFLQWSRIIVKTREKQFRQVESEAVPINRIILDWQGIPYTTVI